MSPGAEPLTLYVTTGRTPVKVGNILADPRIAFVIPVPHRFLPVVPPAAVEFIGTAEILDGEIQMLSARSNAHGSTAESCRLRSA